MKKLLTILGTVALVGATTTNMVCMWCWKIWWNLFSTPVGYRATYLNMSKYDKNDADEWVLEWIPYYYSFGSYKYNLTINENKYNQFKNLLVNLLGNSFITPNDEREKSYWKNG